MAGPRIIFTHFTRGDSPKLVTWAEHHARVTSEQLLLPSQRHSAVVWQLVSSNNRELARGGAVHPSYASAHAAAAEIARCADQLQVELVSHERAGMHGWYLALHTAPVVLCARWFAADRERRYSIQLAVASLAQVELADGARQYIDRPLEPIPNVPARRDRPRHVR